MATIYRQDDGGTLKAMPLIRCKNEQKELQDLLESHYGELLPGEQVDPENPRRWMLIKREMPVQDPGSGTDRWSIDFFFVDQSAMPTFVECKRHDDSGSRRKVVGQMLEYAANGHFYWTKERIRDYAEESAKKQGTTLDAAIENLAPEDDYRDTDSFLEQIQHNLQEGQVRLIFFLEEAPSELKSIVDFLNKQMERAEVLLVEARQYSDGKTQLIVPTLFGYTEQARQIKKTTTIKSAARRRWDEVSFFQRATSSLNNRNVQRVRELYDYAKSHSFEIWWGSGAVRGSFSIVAPAVCSRSFMSVFTDGQVWLNFEFLYGSQKAEAFRDALRREVTEKLQMPMQEGKKFLFLDVDKWGPQLEKLMASVSSLVERHAR